MSASRNDRGSLIRLAIYYLLLLAAGFVLVRFFPQLHQPFSFGRLEDLAGAPAEFRAAPQGVGIRTVGAVLSMIGALVLVVPVAWVYMLTKRAQRYDPSVVQTVIMLPIAVAGIVMIVQNSIALAFSLAGIVAAVRFRNTLKDTKDAVYVFLAIGIGLAAGVQALTLALVMSLIFNLVVLGLWHFNVGDIYTVPAVPGEQNSFDGVLSIRAQSPEAARKVVEPVLEEATKRWRPHSPASGEDRTLAYRVRLKKRTPIPVLVQLIRDRAADQHLEIAFQPGDGESS
ncbi:MAG: hypothetical protein KatS3mg081_1661 [Gemmatimonadales bacterium]|nr:hypothetical protein HRbin33_02714 [bacterium HR33]GIW52306.1 MAG: hypothetical protein KatS3mg081_1661 [Gemmatimonadales bacterium]